MGELGEESIGRSVLEKDAEGRHRLAASRCPECGDVRTPRRDYCVNDGLPCERILLSGRGEIYEAVFVSVPPKGFDHRFWAGYIDLDEGARIFAQIACAEDEKPPSHGQRVEMTTLQIGVRAVLAPVFTRAPGQGERDAPG